MVCQPGRAPRQAVGLAQRHGCACRGSGAGLRQMLAQPAQWTPEDGVLMPVAVDDAATKVAEPILYVHEDAGLVAVLDLPCFLGRPAGAGAAHCDLWMVAQVDHAGWVVDGPAAPALAGRRRVGMSLGRGHRAVHGQALVALAVALSLAAMTSTAKGVFA